MARGSKRTLTVEVLGDSKSMSRMFGSAGKDAEGFGGKMRKVAGGLTKAFAVVGGAIAGAAGGLAALTKQTASYGDRVAKTSRTVGLSTEAFQELEFALGQFGLTGDETEKVLTRFNKRIGEAVDGQGTAVDAVEKLGISLRDTSGELRDQDAIFDDVIRSLQDVETSQERAALASDFFGDRSGPKLASAMEAGADSIDELRAKAHDLGLVMGDDAAQAAERFNDRMDDLTQSFQGAVRTGVTPIMAAVADELLPMILDDAVPALRKFGDRAGEAFADVLSTFNESGIQGVFTKLLDRWVEAFPRILEWFATDVLPDMLTRGVRMATAVAEGLRDNIPEIVGAIADALVDTVEWLASEGIPTLVTVGAELLIGLADGLVGAVGQLVDRLPQIVQAITTFFSGDTLTEILQAGVTIITTLIEGVADNIGPIADAIFLIIPQLATAITQMVPALTEAGVAIAVAIGQGLVKAVPQIVSAFGQTFLATFAKELREMPAWAKVFLEAVPGVKPLIKGTEILDEGGLLPTATQVLSETVPSVQAPPHIMDHGGVLMPGDTARNLSGRPELIVDPDQTDGILSRLAAGPTLIQNFWGQVNEQITGRQAAFALRMAG